MQREKNGQIQALEPSLNGNSSTAGQAHGIERWGAGFQTTGRENRH